VSCLDCLLYRAVVLGMIRYLLFLRIVAVWMTFLPCRLFLKFFAPRFLIRRMGCMELPKIK